MTTQPASSTRVYDGDGDLLMRKDRAIVGDHVTLIPDTMPSKNPDQTPRLRIMWGHPLLEDLLAGRYRSLVCAVNTRDNSHGIIAQLASLLPTSQWDDKSITAYAAHFAARDSKVKVLKFDMDMLEVLAIVRPDDTPNLTIPHLGAAFRIVADMISHDRWRLPSASVSFLGARANALLESNRREPTFETVLRTMYESGYTGDVYPPASLWNVGDVAVFARYPFSKMLDEMRTGGF